MSLPVFIGDAQIGVLGAFQPSSRPVSRLRELNIPPSGYYIPARSTGTITVERWYVSPEIVNNMERLEDLQAPLRDSFWERVSL